MVTFSGGDGHNTTPEYHKVLTLEKLEPFQHPDQALRGGKNLSNFDWYVVYLLSVCMCACMWICVCGVDVCVCCVCVCVCVRTCVWVRVCVGVHPQD